MRVAQGGPLRERVALLLLPRRERRLPLLVALRRHHRGHELVHPFVACPDRRKLLVVDVDSLLTLPVRNGDLELPHTPEDAREKVGHRREARQRPLGFRAPLLLHGLSHLVLQLRHRRRQHHAVGVRQPGDRAPPHVTEHHRLRGQRGGLLEHLGVDAHDERGGRADRVEHRGRQHGHEGVVPREGVEQGGERVDAACDKVEVVTRDQHPPLLQHGCQQVQPARDPEGGEELRQRRVHQRKRVHRPRHVEAVVVRHNREPVTRLGHRHRLVQRRRHGGLRAVAVLQLRVPQHLVVQVEPGVRRQDAQAVHAVCLPRGGPHAEAVEPSAVLVRQREGEAGCPHRSLLRGLGEAEVGDVPARLRRQQLVDGLRVAFEHLHLGLACAAEPLAGDEEVLEHPSVRERKGGGGEGRGEKRRDEVRSPVRGEGWCN
eukprot:Rhum_TRINITY_DN14955_c8_g1::Rhum_TRINITY_DN14955_c8_g1_i1::g.130068::m.130068